MPERPDPQFILASSSPVRRQLLVSAGLSFDSFTPDVDEDILKQSMAGSPAAEIATALAGAKANAVAARPEFSGRLVIGADQMLVLDDILLDKPPDMAAAKKTLQQLRGRAHQLVGAVVLVRDRRPVWSHVGSVTLWMRNISDEFVDRYLASEGDAVCDSVGAYRLEGLGAQLFSRIEGDYFSVLGLALLPLLEALRSEGAIPE